MASSLLSRQGAPASGADLPAPDAAAVRAPAAPAPLRLVERVRLAAVCLGFLGLTFAQQPGRVLGDTKLDLAVDPLGFLGRALQLWEPEGFAGQVQNQAYGYLFPMGPFFAAGDGAGLPPWVVQRLWMALVLSVAFLGVVALARRLALGSPAAQLIGGLAYALAPRMVTALGVSSVELVPMALAPWVLVPLVSGARGGSPRRAALLSGLAVCCVGGVNAVATAAVLPLAVLWLLTRPAGPRRRRLLAWWVAAVGLATAWWAGPLLLLGRYSPPFLDYIETADITTATTDLLATLRGTTQWVAHLSTPDGPVWPAGWSLLHDALPVLATVVLAAVGLSGLARRDLRDRTWLVLGVLAGLALVGLGHLGTVQGVLAGQLHELLDGPLAPLRNVHKFDPVLRLPLALGLVHVCGVLLRRSRRWAAAGPLTRTAPRPQRIRVLGAAAARAGVAGVVLALLASASPALAGRLAPPSSFEGLPPYWELTADWLADRQPSGRALLLPGSSFGTYVWGSTGDEPMQPLADSPWEVRNAIPLSPPGHIRMLDVVEQRLARGEGSAGLASFLARSGISHLVVRNDLDAGAADATRSSLVLQALRRSPGITAAVSFGPRVPGQLAVPGRAFDAFLTPQRPAVEVYEVADVAPRASTTPLSRAVTVAGGPDGLLALADRGLLGDRPALLAGGGEPASGGVLVSDAQQRRERTFGRIARSTSSALTEDDPLRLGGAARDYLYAGYEHGESVVRIHGARISAGSSAGDADSFRGADPAAHPAAAVDGDPTTAWRPAARIGDQDVWWRIETERLVTADTITVQLADGAAPPPVGFVVRTDRGEHTVALADTSAPQELPLPLGATHSVTLIAEGGPGGGPAAGLALAEVEVPGVDVERTVVVPPVEGRVSAYAFDTPNPAAGGCVVQPSGRPVCSVDLVRGPEEGAGLDRTFTVDRAAAYDLGVTVVPRAGAALDALVARTARPLGPDVAVSSAAVPDPRGSAAALVDGDRRTAWVAAATDGRPTITVSWLREVTVDRLRLATAPGTAASLPLTVTVGDGTAERTVPLDGTGVAEFPPLTTSRLEISFPLLDQLASFDPYTRSVVPLGVGVGELQLDGLPMTDPRTPVHLPCGEGPVVEVDGEPRATSLETTLGALRSLQPVDLVFCGGDGTTGLLGRGEHRFVARSTDVFAVTSATLGDPDVEATGASARTAAEVTRWDAGRRTVEVRRRSEPTLLVVPENQNAGWVATLDGVEVEARTVDGWQQGYVLPAGPAGEVDLEFRPGTTYRTALLAGAAAVALLVVLLLLPVRGPTPPATGRRARPGALGLLAAAGLLLLAGPWGPGAVVVGAVLIASARTRRPVVARWLVLGGVAGGGLLALLLPADAGRPAGQALALLAVGTLVASLLPTGSLTRPRQRRRGRSSPA